MRTGLRTEIVLSISLLLAAALLFVGFLLVKLSERNLLDQKISHAEDVIKLIAAGAELPFQPAEIGNNYNLVATRLDRLQFVLGKHSGVISWRLLDDTQRVVSSVSYRQTDKFETIAPSALQKGEIIEKLNYDSFNWFRSKTEENYIDLSTSLWTGTDPYGLLQVRFSLADVQMRVGEAQRLIIVYVIFYGLVLAAFGVFMLNRNVVKPIRLLQQATTKIATGNLTPVNVESGPGEIHELAGSFNQMVESLTASRAETESHIASLEATNLALERARDDLVRSEKLATVGHLAAGMAHEIGNSLGAVVGYLNILKEDLSGNEKDLVERSLTEASRIDLLLRELLEYSAPVDRQTESFCPVTLLHETVEMLRHQGQLDDVQIEKQRDLSSCMVSMDRSRLMQVWINLLLNARDAMNGKGTIKFETICQDGEVCISIQDEGEGIPPAVLNKVFEPFFTTKAPGKGYGLGLAVCQRIIDESGGSISVSSEKGQGSRFSVILPCDVEGAS